MASQLQIALILLDCSGTETTTLKMMGFTIEVFI